MESPHALPLIKGLFTTKKCKEALEMMDRCVEIVAPHIEEYIQDSLDLSEKGYLVLC